MTINKSTATYVLSAAMVSLALGLVYFSYTLSRTVVALPDLIEEIQVTQEKFEPLVMEVHAIQVQIPGIVEEVSLVRELIPVIMEDVERMLELVPGIMEEIDQIQGAIPPVLDEAAAYREQIPVILAQVESVQEQIPPILEEVGKVREAVPVIIAQIEAIRAELPAILAQVQAISDDIENAGKKAGEGAVTGVFSGIVKTPLRLVSGFGSRIIPSSPLKESDRVLIVQAGEKLMESDRAGDQRDWYNKDTGFQGSVILTKIYKKDRRPHRDIKIIATRDGTKPIEATVTFVQSSDGAWEIVDP